MAANLMAAGREVIWYLRRAEQAGKLVVFGLEATTNIIDLFNCEITITPLARLFTGARISAPAVSPRA